MAIEKHWHKVGDTYINDKRIDYFSPRYKKHVIVELSYKSDGATGARDVLTDGWWVHDVLKEFKVFADGSRCSNWKASHILRDILLRDGFYVRANTWFISTLAWGTIVK